MPDYDVCGLGHALVDLQFAVTPEQLTDLEIDKGVMTLIEGDRRQTVFDGLGAEPVNQASGGSAANTMITLAYFGGSAYYCFQVGDDDWGGFYRRDLQAAGVGSHADAVQPGDTGQCLVLVTPDADRTMNTFLGASGTMGPHQVRPEAIAASRILYLEGYLLTTTEGLAACQEAARRARQAGVTVSLTLSDPFVVGAFRAHFETLVDAGVNLLFCNEDEAFAFTGLESRPAAVRALAERVPRVCVTLGADGALVVDGDGTPELVAGFPTTAVDTTGAGDTFAGGVLYGITHDLSLAQAAVLGNYGAAHVVSAYGPRPRAPLAQLVGAILARTAPPPADAS